MLIRLAHYSVRATDLAVSTAFYTEALGLAVGPRPPFGFPGVWLYLARDEAHAAQGCVHLIGDGDAGALDAYLGRRNKSCVGPTGALDHIAFFADDWSACRARLNALGVGFTERAVPVLGIRQVFLVDPDGVTVELNFPEAATLA
ncbi:VOC family protein [Phenylobacterium sp.]|uniref:VOC family protein n=1 Tax=Phenylobacterium sp. TaxID=1871053 RepID=UPI00121FCECE|nr:VOC family protein [Phenylobacterium sp.]THD60606.1 MAG: glyoxalase [Phenylobacterium sp.]